MKPNPSTRPQGETPVFKSIGVGSTVPDVTFVMEKGVMVSSAMGRKRIVLEEGAEVESGKAVRVAIVDDTNPDDETKGKLIARVLPDMEQPTEAQWKEVEGRVTGVEKASRKAGKRAAEVSILTELATGKPKTLAERLGMSTEEAIESFKRDVEERETAQGKPSSAAKRVAESSSESMRAQAGMREEAESRKEVMEVLGANGAATLENALVSVRWEELSKAVREDKKIEMELENLAHPPKLSKSKEADAETKMRSIKKRLKGMGVTSAEAEATVDIGQKYDELETKREELLQSSPEAFIGLHLKDLKKYRQQLEEGKIVETPYVEKQALELEANARRGQPVFIYGHLGSGKTELALHVAKKMLADRDDLQDKSALVVSGSKYMAQSELYGHQVLAVKEGVTVSDFYLGPVYQAMEQGRPLIIDEVNGIPHEVLISLNHVLTRRPGDEINVQQNSGRKITVKEGFTVIMTGNLNVGAGETVQKYVNREKLDPAFISRLKLMEHDYLPQETDKPFTDPQGQVVVPAEGVQKELYSVLLAAMMDKQGNVEAPANALQQVWTLANVVRSTQEAFAGKRTAEFAPAGEKAFPVPVQYAVLQMRSLKSVMEAWQANAYQKPLERVIFDIMIKDQPLPQERAWLYQQFQNAGFFNTSDGWENASNLKNVQTGFDVKPPKKKMQKEALEFFTPRDIVETLYGDVPERKRWPVITEKQEAEEEKESSVGDKAEKLAEFREFAEKMEKEIEELASMVEAHCALEQKAAQPATP